MSKIYIRGISKVINFRKATVDDIDNLAKIRSIFIMEVTGCSDTIRNELETANATYFETPLLKITLLHGLHLTAIILLQQADCLFQLYHQLPDVLMVKWHL